MSPAFKLREMCQPYWDESAALQPTTRLSRRDYTLWKPTPQEISDRLGWLDLPQAMHSAVLELEDFVEDARRRRFRDVVLLGMGGSSLCAEVMRETFDGREAFPTLHVLDSTVPAWVRRQTEAIDPARTLFLVASKSGTTIEVMSFYKHFRALVEQTKSGPAGENFAAITDPGTPLATRAAEEGFMHAFINPSNLGGRYSALSHFGLVPCALMGLNVGELLSRAREMSRACGVVFPVEENPGAWLGMIAGCMARAGRDKLTIITSPAVRAFGLWAEQLLAESTGKEGKGIVPIVHEPGMPPSAYGEDRLFVYLHLGTDDNAETDAWADEIEKAGFPLLRSELRDLYDIGGEYFRWEFATAIAGACLRINPFDQPNVKESKDNTARVLAACEGGKDLPPLHDEGGFEDLIESARPGDYLAILNYADRTAEDENAVQDLRAALLSKRNLPTMHGYGPRYLHSTGQLHKGGANNGLFLQITRESDADVPIPGEAYSFGTLAAAQAIGDFEALKAHGRRAVRVRLKRGETLDARFRAFKEIV